MEPETKTIKVTARTYERLTTIGRKGETYDQIVVELLNESDFTEKLRVAAANLKEKRDTSMQKGFGQAVYDSPLINAIDEVLSVLNQFVETVQKR